MYPEVRESLEDVPLRQNGVTVVPATPADTSDPEPFITELSAGERFFEAQSVTRLRIGRRVVQLKIRSVPREALREAIDVLRPKKMPKVFDKNTNTLVIDEDSPAYRAWEASLGYVKVLLGLADMTLRSRGGTIVWQADGEIQEVHASIQALKDMGITTPHINQLVKEIDALSTLDAEDDLDETLGN